MNLKDIALFENSEQVANERLLRYSGEIVMEQKQRIAALEAELAAERERVAELEADRERLDWLEKWLVGGEERQVLAFDQEFWLSSPCDLSPDYSERTLREAIDAAREAKG